MAFLKLKKLRKSAGPSLAAERRAYGEADKCHKAPRTCHASTLVRCPQDLCPQAALLQAPTRGASLRATTLLILQVSRVRSCYVRLRRRACDCRGASSTMRVVPQSCVYVLRHRSLCKKRCLCPEQHVEILLTSVLGSLDWIARFGFLDGLPLCISKAARSHPRAPVAPAAAYLAAYRGLLPGGCMPGQAVELQVREPLEYILSLESFAGSIGRG